MNGMGLALGMGCKMYMMRTNELLSVISPSKKMNYLHIYTIPSLTPILLPHIIYKRCRDNKTLPTTSSNSPGTPRTPKVEETSSKYPPTNPKGPSSSGTTEDKRGTKLRRLERERVRIVELWGIKKNSVRKDQEK